MTWKQDRVVVCYWRKSFLVAIPVHLHHSRKLQKSNAEAIEELQRSQTKPAVSLVERYCRRAPSPGIPFNFPIFKSYRRVMACLESLSKLRFRVMSPGAGLSNGHHVDSPKPNTPAAEVLGYTNIACHGLPLFSWRRTDAALHFPMIGIFKNTPAVTQT